MTKTERQRLNIAMGLPADPSQDPNGPLVTEDGGTLTFNGAATAETAERHLEAMRAERAKARTKEERTAHATLARVLAANTRAVGK